MNVATWAKSNSKEENFNQFQQGIRKLKETLVKVTNVQNEKLDKLSDITEKHKKELNGIHKKMSVMVTAVTNTSKTCRNFFAQENQFRVLTHLEYCAASIKVNGEC